MRDFINQIGNPLGHTKTKENRAQRLINDWDNLYEKFTNLLIRGYNKNKVKLSHTGSCALAMLVMMDTGIRVGNLESANGYYSQRHEYDEELGKLVPVAKSKIKLYSYGLTTLQKKHSSIIIKFLHLKFMGKRQVKQHLIIRNPTIIEFVKVKLAGKANNDIIFDVGYNDLKKFVSRYVGRKFTIKDFRTSYVNLLFVEAISRKERMTFTKKSELNKVIKSKVDEVADIVGHTSGACKKSYLSKDLLYSYKEYLELIMEHNKNKTKVQSLTNL